MKEVSARENAAWILSALVCAVALAAMPAEARLQRSGKVNLNEATAAQLDRLPGVSGEAAAGIVAYRQRQRFARVEELVKVPGFGRKRFERLRPFLAVEGATTFKVVKRRARERPRG